MYMNSCFFNSQFVAVLMVVVVERLWGRSYGLSSGQGMKQLRLAA